MFIRIKQVQSLPNGDRAESFIETEVLEQHATRLSAPAVARTLLDMEQFLNGVTRDRFHIDIVER